MGSVIVENEKKVLTISKCFAGGHLRFVNGEWRDDNGDAIEISRVRHGRWDTIVDYDYLWDDLDYPKCSICGEVSLIGGYYCPFCGAKMDLEE